jgi:hypothetical protein
VLADAEALNAEHHASTSSENWGTLLQFMQSNLLYNAYLVTLPHCRKEPSLYAAEIERTVQAFLQRTPAPADSDLQALDSDIKQVCSSKSSSKNGKSSGNATGTATGGGGAAAGNGYSAANGSGECAGQPDDQVRFSYV